MNEKDIVEGGKKEVRHIVADEFGNLIVLLSTVCPDCLGEKNKYSNKCIKCSKK